MNIKVTKTFVFLTLGLLICLTTISCNKNTALGVWDVIGELKNGKWEECGDCETLELQKGGIGKSYSRDSLVEIFSWNLENSILEIFSKNSEKTYSYLFERLEKNVYIMTDIKDSTRKFKIIKRNT